jgi:hypothetical protein
MTCGIYLTASVLKASKDYRAIQAGMRLKRLDITALKAT